MGDAPAGIGALLGRGGPLVMPGVYDALGARLAREAGFEAVFQTGYGTSASLLGMPDYGLIGAAETVENAGRICRAARAPVLVDADTGYGGPLNVWKLVGDLRAAGAAGMFLEDQVWPKRCGHMRGKEVVPREEYAEKVRAAAGAGEGGFFIVARTDARAAGGLGEAIERARAAVADGADAAFVEAPESADEMREIGRSVRAPLVANMIEGGRTPLLPASELHAMGFSIILYPLSVLYASARAAARVLGELRRSGTTAAAAGEMMDFGGFNDLVGLPELRELEGRYGGQIKSRK